MSPSDSGVGSRRIESEDTGMKRLAAAVAAAVVVAMGNAPAQTTDQMPDQHMQHAGPSAVGASVPTMPGQDAFGAVQEIIRILEADPTTDWSKVNLDALREHLIDMSEVTLHADAAAEHITGGIRVTVTGTGRTLEAIQRMVPDQAHELDGARGWHSGTETRPDGVVLTVTSSDPKQATMIQGLGFIGVMASGAHHQMHHLAMARGEFVP
jgi:hypothetical protein